MIVQMLECNGIVVSSSKVQKTKQSAKIMTKYIYGDIDFSLQLNHILLQMPKIKAKQEDNEFSPIQFKSYRKKRSISRRNIFLNTSVWTREQNQLYVQFLIDQKQNMVELAQRIKLKIFVKMSQFLKKRTPKQCRSHHQKMIQKYQTLQKIIECLLKTKRTKIMKKRQQNVQIREEIFEFIWQPKENTFDNEQDLEKEDTNLQQQKLWQVIDQSTWEL